MANCYDSDSYTADSKVEFKVLCDQYKLKDLTFSKYTNEICESDVISVLNFNPEKI